LLLPPDWLTVGEPTLRQLPDSALHRRVVDVAGGSIDGSLVRFPGLEATITDVFVRISRLDGSEASLVVRPTQPYVQLRGERPWTVAAGEYLVLGFNHILMGIDHLLFVLGLLIIVRGTRMLIKTITAFTLAHSVTLAAATLGYASVPGPPLNAAIALTILFLGPEIVRVWRGQTSFTIRHPWVVAFGFGLLHGFGSASGLSTVGMPKAEIPLALLSFNVGVEIGQLAFVILMLMAYRALRVLMIFFINPTTATSRDFTSNMPARPLQNDLLSSHSALRVRLLVLAGIVYHCNYPLGQRTSTIRGESVARD
jgi:hypothetical protein